MKKFLLLIIIWAQAWIPEVINASEESQEPLYTPSILIVENDDEVAALESKGVVIWRRRGDMVLALIPCDSQTFEKMRKEGRIDWGHKMKLSMDQCRRQFDAEKLYTGEGLPSSYSGKGVVIGLCDVGVDPHHSAFLDKDGRTRVKKIVYYNEPLGVRTVMDTPQSIDAWVTDTDDDWHGTHVANIMAGSDFESGLQGMAPDAEIVVTTSQLYDAGILAACEDIIDYAREVGKPAVINLSLSSYNGPHDGSSLFSRYIAMLGEEAIICMAAGNEGSSRSSYRTVFSELADNWRVRLRSYDWQQFQLRGMTDAWSNDSSPVGVRVLVYDNNITGAVYESQVFGTEGEFETTISSTIDPDFGKYLNGEVTVRGGISSLNGRWVTEAYYDTSTVEPAAVSNGKWARYVVGLEFSGVPGVHADISADCQYSFFQDWPKYPLCTNDLSVSDICSGENVISVGMYHGREDRPVLATGEREEDSDSGKISHYSSYGTLLDGNVLPHTVAPGHFVISAANSAYVDKHKESLPRYGITTSKNGKTYYWLDQIGTSMSTPYVAGAIACWLEANPRLTVDEVRQIIADTNCHDYPDPLNPRHGQGWFRPYEGLKMVINKSGITPGSIDVAGPVAVISRDFAEILNPGEGEIEVRIYGVDGLSALPALVTSHAISAIDISSLGRGTYILVITPTHGSPSAKKFLVY